MATKKTATASKAAKKKAASTPKATTKDDAVAAFLHELDHPLKDEVVALRRIILAAAPGIGEEIKWNAPSFRTSEHFATMNLHARDRVRVIFHQGAKVKASAVTGIAVSDPEGLLEWPSKDRAIATFTSAADVRKKRKPLEALVRSWIDALGTS